MCSIYELLWVKPENSVGIKPEGLHIRHRKNPIKHAQFRATDGSFSKAAVTIIITSHEFQMLEKFLVFLASTIYAHIICHWNLLLGWPGFQRHITMNTHALAD